MKLRDDTILVPIDARKTVLLAVNMTNGLFSFITPDLLEGDDVTPRDNVPQDQLFIADEYTEQQAIARFYSDLMESYKAKVQPEIVIIPWFHCDLSCGYCWQREQGLDKSPARIERSIGDVLDNALLYFKERGWKKVPQVNLFGGEPLLCNAAKKQSILEIIYSVRERGIEAHITTHGRNLHMYFDELHELGIEGFQITVDGSPGSHNRRRPGRNGSGTYDEIVKNIGLAIQYGFNVSIRVNVDERNYDDAEHICRLFFERGWTNTNRFSFYFAPVTDHLTSACALQASQKRILPALIAAVRRSAAGNRLNFDAWRGADVVEKAAKRGYLALPRFHYCPAGVKSQIVVSPDGTLHPCLESVNNPALCIGRWEPVFLVEEGRWEKWSRPVTDVQGCAQCSFRLACGGGCTFARMNADARGELYCEGTHSYFTAATREFLPDLLERVPEFISFVALTEPHLSLEA